MILFCITCVGTRNFGGNYSHVKWLLINRFIYHRCRGQVIYLMIWLWNRYVTSSFFTASLYLKGRNFRVMKSSNLFPQKVHWQSIRENKFSRNQKIFQTDDSSDELIRLLIRWDALRTTFGKERKTNDALFPQSHQ